MLGLLLVGCLLLAASMALYPGGTWCDPGARGHVFFENFVCDLAWRTTLGGAPNPTGATLAQGGMGALSLSATLLFVVAPALYRERPRLGRVTRGAGYAAGLGLFAVTLMPSSVFGDLHAVVVFAAAMPALVALVATLAGLFACERPRVAAWVGLATALAIVVDLALFARHAALRDGCSRAVPALQKVALVLLVAWIAVVGVRVRRA